jgi:CrcB protein
MSELTKQYLWVALGSAIGGVGRFWISGLIIDRMGRVIDWNILIINITGSFVIGVLGAWTSPSGRLTPEISKFGTTFLMIGICGGYTTFSSFSLGTLKLARDGEWLYAGGYVAGSVIFCLLAVWVGWWLGQKIMS